MLLLNDGILFFIFNNYYYLQISRVLALIKTTKVFYLLFIPVIMDFSDVTSCESQRSATGGTRPAAQPPSRPARLKRLTDVVHSLQSRHDVGSAGSL